MEINNWIKWKLKQDITPEFREFLEGLKNKNGTNNT